VQKQLEIYYIFLGGGHWNNITNSWDQRYNDIHIFDTVTMKWHCPETKGYIPLSCFSSMCKVGYFLLVVGGSRTISDATQTSSAYLLDIVTHTWYPIVHEKKAIFNKPIKKCLVSLIKLDEKVIVLGGDPKKPVNWKSLSFKNLLEI